MPDNSSFNIDGSFKWLKKQVPPAPFVEEPTQHSLDNRTQITLLYAANIKSDVVGESFKILKDGLEVSNFEISEITSNTLVGNTIILYSSDLEPITLIFINNTEATNGDDRLTIILNGGNVT